MRKAAAATHWSALGWLR